MFNLSYDQLLSLEFIRRARVCYSHLTILCKTIQRERGGAENHPADK